MQARHEIPKELSLYCFFVGADYYDAGSKGKRHGIFYLSTNYVSHSFDQYVLTDQQGNIVALDLGDGYPRVVVLTRTGKSAVRS